MSRPPLGPRARRVVYSTRLTADETERVEAISQGMTRSQVAREALIYWLTTREEATAKIRKAALARHRPTKVIEKPPEPNITHWAGDISAAVAPAGTTEPVITHHTRFAATVPGARHLCVGTETGFRYENGTKIIAFRCECGRTWER